MSLNHNPFFILKERIQCLFEGGKRCRKEDPRAQKGENAVRGLHSNWVGTRILASARPQQPIVQREGTLKDLLSKNVKGIINLQEVGEHAGCGSGILKHTGFSYDPDYFMQVGCSSSSSRLRSLATFAEGSRLPPTKNSRHCSHSLCLHASEFSSDGPTFVATAGRNMRLQLS